MKLIPMTDFVLDHFYNNPNKYGDYTDLALCIKRYAEFLKRPLKLEMFVPLDDKGNFLHEPLQGYPGNEQYEGAEMDCYQKAAEKVLFEGFTFSGNGMFTCGEEYLISQHAPGKFKWLVNTGRKSSTFNSVKTIEEIINLGGFINLTPSAIKLIEK